MCQKIEIIKVKIVYNVSARTASISPSFNDYLETGPAMQHLLRSTIFGLRLRPIIAFCGEVRKTIV